MDHAPQKCPSIVATSSRELTYLALVTRLIPGQEEVASRERRVSAVAANTIEANVDAEANQHPGPTPKDTIVAMATIAKQPKKRIWEIAWRDEPAPTRANNALAIPNPRTATTNHVGERQVVIVSMRTHPCRKRDIRIAPIMHMGNFRAKSRFSDRRHGQKPFHAIVSRFRRTGVCTFYNHRQ